MFVSVMSLSASRSSSCGRIGAVSPCSTRIRCSRSLPLTFHIFIRSIRMWWRWSAFAWCSSPTWIAPFNRRLPSTHVARIHGMSTLHRRLPSTCITRVHWMPALDGSLPSTAKPAVDNWRRSLMRLVAGLRPIIVSIHFVIPRWRTRTHGHIFTVANPQHLHGFWLAIWSIRGSHMSHTLLLLHSVERLSRRTWSL